MQGTRVVPGPLNYVSVRTLSGFEDTINCLQFNGDASCLAIGSDSGLFVVAHTGVIDDPVMEFRAPNGSAVTALLWNPADPESIFIGYSDGTVLICQVPLVQSAVSAIPNCSERSRYEPSLQPRKDMIRLEFGLRGPVQAFTYMVSTSTLAVIIGSHVVCSQDISGGKISS